MTTMITGIGGLQLLGRDQAMLMSEAHAGLLVELKVVADSMPQAASLGGSRTSNRDDAQKPDSGWVGPVGPGHWQAAVLNDSRQVVTQVLGPLRHNNYMFVSEDTMAADWDSLHSRAAAAVRALRSGALPPAVIPATDSSAAMHGIKGPFAITCVFLELRKCLQAC